jgi:NTP pyrophosphatase (non-canonical NTP hydrolase)
MIETFREYQKEALFFKGYLDEYLKLHPDTSDDMKQLLSLSYDGLGLGEAGEVQGKIKKIIRDNGGVITEEAKKSLIFEIGDTLWYLTSLCDTLGTTLEYAAETNIEKLKSRHERDVIHGNGDYR